MVHFLNVARYLLLFSLLGAAIAAARAPTLLNIGLAGGALAMYLIAEPLMNRQRNRKLEELLSADRHRLQVLLAAFPVDGGVIESSDRHLTNPEETVTNRAWFAVVERFAKRLNTPGDEFSNRRLEKLRKAFINHCGAYVEFLRAHMQPTGGGTDIDFPDAIKSQPQALEGLAFRMRAAASDVSHSYRRVVRTARRKLHI